MPERHVKLFRNGGNQALPGEDAIIRRDGRRLIIEAAPPRSLLAVLAALRPLPGDFPPIEELPHDAVDL